MEVFMNLKKMAALRAVDEIDDGDVVGLGTGSTTHYFIEELGRRVREEGLEVMGVPTSYQSMFLAAESGIKVTSLAEHDVDVAVDGADEVDPDLNLIKGGGAAHTLEKIVDSSAASFIVIVDESKLVERLGAFPLPVEVIPAACRPVKLKLESMGASVNIRSSEGKDGPVVTDNGNFVLDAAFGVIDDPGAMESRLNNIPGVVENGIFAGIADMVIAGTSEGLKILR
ncbi:ribose 5-phosphate isomerase [Methanothermobacter thermautotrophicus str. Delta H]|uniref:Ribose-5-phosphate isomerase A n=2 Tax=Methanothermobacter thermautotrophicus TaxID=145262 RepID=RPIA_METTH|nr:RecName: Full=Ribose-5-phosphate isomerase A; AltName: Full=Phosphoriboisomerase A; Short=PRI [Methanothermobacter thermautotrophicus str. Delta H]AAB85114.1 ribose 5-phosphate isomerase [Methanothermobacter thermautotrophicus str. Delta H]BAA13646.1 orf2 [Methanothermobacter thermautotrophicus]